MNHTIFLTKMSVSNGMPIQYYLNQTLCINDYLNQTLQIQHTGNKHCIACNRKIRKTFFEGLCYPCFQSSPLASECIIRPELCQAHLGKGRDPEWEAKYHNQPHIVYLAISSGLKVGITQSTNTPTRWIDQGAISAIRIAEVPYRYLAGCIEVTLKDHVSDRTAWQKMLKNDIPNIDLITEKNRIVNLLPTQYHQYLLTDTHFDSFDYPVNHYPQKVKSINLDKIPLYNGVLTGIKGQYLLFSDGFVLNIRKHSGYEVKITTIQ
tara:strand:- start:678 stop:1469 length:792 start_codon:yes stop_codon:yes gene_type:complete